MKDKIIMGLVTLLIYAIGFLAVYGAWHLFLHNFK